MGTSLEHSLLTSALTEVSRLSLEAAQPSCQDRKKHLKQIRRLVKRASQLEELLGDLSELLSPAPTPEPVAEPEPEPEPVKAVEVAEVQPEPVVAKAPPKPKPVLEIVEAPPVTAPVVIAKAKEATSTEKRAYRAKLNELQARHTQLRGDGEHGPFAYKALVAASRAVLERAVSTIHDLTEAEPEHNSIIELFNQRDNSEFFGLNRGRHQTVDAWEQVDLAYRFQDDALVGLKYSDLPEDLVNGLAACVQYLFHVNEHFNLLINDFQARASIDTLRSKYPNVYMKALAIHSDNALRLDEVRAMAANFAPALKAWSQKEAKAKDRDRATQALSKLLEVVQDTSDPGAYEAQVLKVAHDCLEAGIPPSNKELVRQLLPYRAFFEASSGPVKSLRAALDKELLAMISMRGLPADPPEPDDVDADHEKRVEELKPLLKGKVLLLVGGNKGQGWRKDDLQKTLGLKEVIWPDLEDGTNVNQILPHVSKCDFAAQLIRFSRHSYAGVLSLAKEQGKPTVRVLSGLGTRRIIHDLHTQLVEKAS